MTKTDFDHTFPWSHFVLSLLFFYCSPCIVLFLVFFLTDLCILCINVCRKTALYRILPTGRFIWRSDVFNCPDIPVLKVKVCILTFHDKQVWNQGWAGVKKKQTKKEKLKLVSSLPSWALPAEGGKIQSLESGESKHTVNALKCIKQ